MSIDFEELGQETIQSQYSSSPHIMGLVEEFRKQIDPTADIEEFYKKFFDPRTARGIGLDIWGIIVGIGREIEVDENDFFGFFGSGLTPMDNSPFYYEGATKIYKLQDEAYRELIFLKAYANISDATMPNIKYVLNKLLPNGAIAIEAEHMKLRIIFLSYEVQPYSMAIFKKYGLLNLGAGVGWEFYIIDPAETFGFDGSLMQQFDQGIFAPYDVQTGEE
jgi:hypothetical protein